MIGEANREWARRLILASGMGHCHGFLDVGGGDGNLCHWIEMECGATGAVLDPRPQNPNHVKGWAEALPFDGLTFDAVIFSHTAHLLRRPVVAMREAYRVLRPGGFLLIRTSTHSDLAQTPATRWDPVAFEQSFDRLPDGNRIVLWMRRAGFLHPIVTRFQTAFEGEYEDFIRGSEHLILASWRASGCAGQDPLPDAESWLRREYPEAPDMHETLLTAGKPCVGD